jgi:hypothetical protein
MELVPWRKQSMLDDQHRDCPDVGHTVLQNHQKTSPFCALLLDTQPSSHYCSHTLSKLALLPAESLL